MRVAFLGGTVLLFALCGLGDEELLTFIIADFEDCMVPSMYVEQWGAFTDGASGKASVTCLTDPVSPERGEVIKVDYRVPFGYSFSGFYMKWECPNFDPNEWEYVTFYVRGDPSFFTRRIKVEVKIRGWGWKVCYFDSVTTKWQKVVLPLKDFKWPGPGPAGWWKTNEFVITFEHERVTRWRGTIYIDNVGFAKHVPVGAQPPTADFSFSPERPTVGEEVRFTDESTDPDGRVVSWRWEFGDGTISTERNPIHRYSRNGTFKVKLTVADNDGLTDVVEKGISVNAPPSASFAFSPPEPRAGEEVAFDASGSKDLDGKIVRYLWDFDGDGETDAEGVKASYAFPKAGTYVVTLTVVDDNGAAATHREEVHVARPPSGFRDVWALVVGISDYRDEGIRDLKYSEEDARAFHGFLVSPEGGGFLVDHVRLLLGKEASLKEIRKGLSWLRDSSTKEDLVVFFFAGHGTFDVDRDGDEQDRIDEYLVPHDAEVDAIAATCLCDDEVGYWLGQVKARGLVVILDSCFSGGNLRAVRSFGEGGRRAGPGNRVFTDLVGEGRIFIAASQEHETAQESDKLNHGVFTYFLLRGLGYKELPGVEGPEADYDKDGRVTIEELGKYLGEQVPGYAPGQHPIVIGDETLKRIPLPPRPPLLGEVTAVEEEYVAISLGTRQGVKVGDRFEVFRELVLPDGKVIPEVRAIIEVVAVLGPDRAACRIVVLHFPVEVKDRVRPAGGGPR